MKSLDELVALLADVQASSGVERYEKFDTLSEKVDNFAVMLLYNNRKADMSPYRHDYAMLVHNAIQAFQVAQNFTRGRVAGRVFKHTKTDTPYTPEEVQEAIDRNDAVAVLNYGDTLALFKMLTDQLLAM